MIRLEEERNTVRPIDEVFAYGGTRILWVLELEFKAGGLTEKLAGPFMKRVGRAALNGLAKRLADERPLR